MVSRLARIVLTVGLVVAVLSGLVPPTPMASAQPEPSPALLPPVELEETWDTTGVALGDYRVIGYVLYDARSTGASTVAVTNLRKVYLPIVLRGY